MGVLRLAFYTTVRGIVVSAIAEWLKRTRMRARELPSSHYDSLARVKLWVRAGKEVGVVVVRGRRRLLKDLAPPHAQTGLVLHRCCRLWTACRDPDDQAGFFMMMSGMG
jgi:hypothetical protein